MADIRKMSDTWWRRVTKKANGKPLPLIILQTRTLSTAVEILEWIQDMPFKKLSMSLYFYCQDVGMKEFTRAYETQLELAGANPEKFAMGLHRFYNEMAHKIQKENQYDLFFEFYYRCVRLRIRNEDEKIDATVSTTFVAGRKTTGEILVREDPFPTFDLPIYELRSAFEQGKKFENAEEHLYEMYRKAGYEIYNADDQMRIVAQDKIHTTTCCTLLPFINEYTFDILPKTIYNANSDIIHKILTWVDLDTIKADLKHRKRTLPTNGVRITFSGTEIISEILFKEILWDNSFYMLYRISTSNGDLSGVYETRDSFFYSIFQTSVGHEYLTAGVESLVLFCYATQVLGGEYNLEKINRFISVQGCDRLTATGYGQGGRLRNVYDGVQPKREGDYVAGETSIQGYIRKLPAGQKASQEAKELAESLGYDLESNETYVRPFIRQVFRLKERTE